jgi:hypothetical protein
LKKSGSAGKQENKQINSKRKKWKNKDFTGVKENDSSEMGQVQTKIYIFN